MYEELLKLLTAKFSQARKDGLQQMARSMALHVADNTEATALVDKIQNEQVTKFIKDWRKEVDSEVSKGTRSFEENLKGKYDLIEKKVPTTPKVGDTDNPTDIASIVANAIATAIAPLQTKISAFESGRTTENRKDVLMGKLTDAPEVFKNTVLKNFDRMTFSSQDEFDTFVQETEADSKTIEQELANSSLGNFPIPQDSTNNKKVGEEVNSDIANWAKANNTNSKTE